MNVIATDLVSSGGPIRSPVVAVSGPVVLSDGTRLALRALRPDDRERYVRALRGLSAETLFRRFGGPKHRLSDSEVDRFLDVGHEGREAVVATDSPGHEIIAVARVAPWPNEEGTGDVGIVVADAWQRRGLGTILMASLLIAAAQHGYVRLRATSLVENRPAASLLRRHGFRCLSTSYGVSEWLVDLSGLLVVIEHTSPSP